MGRFLRQDSKVIDGTWEGIGEVYNPAGGIVSTAQDMTNFMLISYVGMM